jgi:protein involved in sex pheromone biosynthesis
MKRKSVMLLLASMLMFTGCGNTSNTTVSEDTEVTSEVESESEIEDDETSINYDIIDEAGVVTFGSDNVTFELEVVDSTEF